MLVGAPVADARAQGAVKMETYQMVLLKAGPQAGTTSAEARQPLILGHLAYFRQLVIDGKLVLVGPMTDDGPVKGILVFRGTPEEAQALAEGDPAVKAGLFVPDVHPWLSQEGLGNGYAEAARTKPIHELPMEPLQFAFLVRGPKYTPELTPEVEKIQRAHLTHIGDMAKAGKLVIAGPFLDGGNLRGVFVFRCPEAEAKALAAEDPAVKAGRLLLEFHPWMLNTAAIPAPAP